MNSIDEQPRRTSPPPLPAQTDFMHRYTPLIVGIAMLLVVVILFALLLSTPQVEVGGERVVSVQGQSIDGGLGTDGDDNEGDSKHDQPKDAGHSTSAADGESPNQGIDEPTDESKGENVNAGNVRDFDEINDEQVEATLPVEADPRQQSTEESATNSFFTFRSPHEHSATRGVDSSIGGNGKAEFFGVEAKGRKFVYVVDVSSSMLGGKFEKARQELFKSIDNLGRDQYFYIMFFNDIPHHQPTKGLVSARSRQIGRKVHKWIMDAFPSGGTSPLEAIKYAIQLGPDAIYVLSDGEFDGNVVSQVRVVNAKSKVPIHAIGFETDAATLKMLATENGGNYRYVK